MGLSAPFYRCRSSLKGQHDGLQGGGMDEPGSSEALSNGGDATDVANDDGAIDDGARPVVIVTGDFAMQNVILQMGLCLAAPDGRRIGRLSRWVLRCSACFKVTKVDFSL